MYGIFSLATSQVQVEWIPLGAVSTYLLVVLMVLPAWRLSYWIWRGIRTLRRHVNESEQLNPTYRIRRNRLKIWIFVSCGLIAHSCLVLYLELRYKDLHEAHLSFPVQMIFIVAASFALGWILDLFKGKKTQASASKQDGGPTRLPSGHDV